MYECTVDRMRSPGAATSTSPLDVLKLARFLLESVAATAITPGYIAGRCCWLWLVQSLCFQPGLVTPSIVRSWLLPQFPAEATEMTPCICATRMAHSTVSTPTLYLSGSDVTAWARLTRPSKPSEPYSSLARSYRKK